MNKNIIKIIIKTCFSVIIIGISLLFILVALADDIEETAGWTKEDNLRYDYENGNYDSIMYDITDYDTSDEKYSDDWKVIEAYKLRYDYDICKKIYDETMDDEYLDKLDEIKDDMEECVEAIDDDYKKDVAKMFLEEIE